MIAVIQKNLSLKRFLNDIVCFQWTNEPEISFTSDWGNIDIYNLKSVPEVRTDYLIRNALRISSS